MLMMDSGTMTMNRKIVSTFIFKVDFITSRRLGSSGERMSSEAFGLFEAELLKL